MIGQTFAVIGMAVAKLSLGFFLLRIVVDKWQRILIWFTMGSLSAVSALCAIMFWTQCTPVQKIFDPIRAEGVCKFSVTPYATALGGEFCVSLELTRLIPRCSLVHPCGFLLCYLPMGLHMEVEHEAEGEDHYCGQHELRLRVRFGILV